MSISRKLAAALAIAAVAVPAATAQAQPADMHASVAQAAAKANERQDLRSADARDAAIHPRGPGHPVNALGATAVDSASQKPLPGAPTWPVNPQPIKSAPAAEPVDTGDGVDWTTIALGIAGSLIAVGGLALVANRRRTPRLRTSG
jgi:hypothetical protein